MSSSYPGTIDSYTDPAGTSLLINPDHAVDHANIHSAIRSIEQTMGTTQGTALFGAYASTDKPVRANASNILQQVIGGTVNLSAGTITGQIVNSGTIGGGVYGTAQITGGTVSAVTLTGQLVNSGTIGGGSYGTANFISGTTSSQVVNNATIGTPAITGGTATNLTLTTPTFADAAIPSKKIGAGAVLQVIQSTIATNVSVSNSTFIDTGVAGTITPNFSTSKILAMVSISGINSGGGGAGGQFNLLRGAGTVHTPESYLGAGSDLSLRQHLAFNYLDSPGTTGATVYKVMFNLSIGTAPFQIMRDNTPSSITLMEIAG